MSSLLDQLTQDDLKITRDQKRSLLQRYVFIFKKCFPDHLDRDNRRGQLNPDHDYNKALTDTYNYQRSHLETFKKALEDFNIQKPDAEGLRVIDIGAGACTTRFALAEHWPKMLRHIDYIAIEPNLSMQVLGKELSQIFGLSSPYYLEDITEIPLEYLTTSKRYLITLSYVVGQNSVTTKHISAWGDTIKKLTYLLDRPVEVLMTTAKGFNSGWEQLYEYLSKAPNNLVITRDPRLLAISHKYPNSVRKPTTFTPWDGRKRNVEMDFWIVNNE